MTGADALAAFLVGLLGSGHCVAMCGGIAGALSLRAGARGGARGGTVTAGATAVPLYSVGRIGSYALLGAAAGALGAVATTLVPAVLEGLRLVAGGLLVAMGLYLAGLWNGLVRLERLGTGLFAAGRAATRSLQGPLEPLGLGVLWGLLPCGLVYSALALALTQATAAGGALVMVAFGAGTLPAVVLAGFAGLPLGRALRHAAVRRVAGALLIGFGLWTLAFALPHGPHHAGMHGEAAASPDAGAAHAGPAERHHAPHRLHDDATSTRTPPQED